MKDTNESRSKNVHYSSSTSAANPAGAEGLSELEVQQLKFNLQLQRKKDPNRLAFAQSQHNLQREKTLERWQKEEAGGLRGPYKKPSKVVHLSDMLAINEQTGQLSMVQDHRGRDKARTPEATSNPPHNNDANARHTTSDREMRKRTKVKQNVIIARHKWLASLEERVSMLEVNAEEDTVPLTDLLFRSELFILEDPSTTTPNSSSKTSQLLNIVRELGALYEKIGQLRRKVEETKTSRPMITSVPFTHKRPNKVLVASSTPIGEVPALVNPMAVRNTSINNQDTQSAPAAVELSAKDTNEVSCLLALMKTKVAYLRTVLVPSVNAEAQRLSQLSEGPARNPQMSSASPAESENELSEEDAEMRAEALAIVSNKTKCNFFPPLSQFGVGAHPIRVDWRSAKRHPQLIKADQLSNMAQLSSVEESLVDKVLSEVATPKLDKLMQLGFSPQTIPTQFYGDPHSTLREGSEALRGIGGIPFTRDYVTNILTDALDDLAHTLIETLREAQQKLKEKKPLHYKARMRYVCGLREVMTSIVSGRCLCVLMAPDVENISAAENDENIQKLKSIVEGNEVDDFGTKERTENTSIADLAIASLRKTVSTLGLEGSVRAIIAACAIKRIPVVYCLSRMRMAYSIRQRGMHVSCIAILSVNGAHAQYRSLISEAKRCRIGYDLVGSAGAEKNP